jgi:hypothetical protein
LGRLPVEQFVWTVAGPQAAGVPTADDAEAAEAEPAAARSEATAAEGWLGALDQSQTVGRWQGQRDSITLRYAPVWVHAWLSRLAAILAVGLLAAGAVILVRWGLLMRWLARWPCAFAAAAGLGWWLCLRPSLLGLVVVAAAGVGQLLARRSRRQRVESLG